jgi:hypothetical protein
VAVEREQGFAERRSVLLDEITRVRGRLAAAWQRGVDA